MMIQICLNGESREIPQSLNLEQLLKQLNLNPRQVAVAKNWEVVVHSEMAQTRMSEGDEIEIFHAVGGG